MRLLRHAHSMNTLWILNDKIKCGNIALYEVKVTQETSKTMMRVNNEQANDDGYKIIVE